MKLTRNPVAREDWIRNQLTKIPSGSKILDAGAGEMPYRKYCAHLDYRSQDFVAYDGTGSVGLHSGNFDSRDVDIKSEIYNIPLGDGEMDAVLCTEVLEHLAYPLRALQELKRILKPGGILLITAPVCSLTHQAPHHYYSGYTTFFYEHHLREMGFKNVAVEANGDFFRYLHQELGRVGYVLNRYGTSRKRLGIFARVLLFLTERMMANFSFQSQGSSELLCFGLHVTATKGIE